MEQRHFSYFDNAILAFDKLLKKNGKPERHRPSKPYPAAPWPETTLNNRERLHVTGLMRINHTGEIAAQALYKAQALSARDQVIIGMMRTAAVEEYDHLCWCETRLRELNGHTSYLAPFWAASSFAIGMLAGKFGDKWSLGFLAETEHQVVSHLQDHLNQLPSKDKRSRAILEQMQIDEGEHACTAESAGGNELPQGIKKLMFLASQIMKKIAYRI